MTYTYYRGLYMVYRHDRDKTDKITIIGDENRSVKAQRNMTILAHHKET